MRLNVNQIDTAVPSLEKSGGHTVVYKSDQILGIKKY